MAKDKFIAINTHYHSIAMEHAFQIKCKDCGAYTTFKHDTKMGAGMEHRRRGHSDETCAMLKRDAKREQFEMTANTSEGINGGLESEGQQTLEFE